MNDGAATAAARGSAGVTMGGDAGRWWRLYAAAALSFLPALGFYYVGEEAIFPISSLEMWFSGDWIRQHLYGGNVQHNPLFNWLIVPAAAMIGWEYVLPVTRAYTVAATAATGLVLYWLARGLYGNNVFAIFAAVAYLTLADLFFYRGWLAYVDPLFALFVFSSIACLWLACERRSHALLMLGAAALTCGFMSKALTAYVFYGGSALVLLVARRDYRTFLLGPGSWFIHITAVALPLAWLYLVPVNEGQGRRLFVEMLAKLAPASWTSYAGKLIAYPVETILRLAPVAFIAGYCWWKGARERDEALARHTRIAGWIALVGYLPYWLAPQSSVRYLLPLYPLIGLILARAIWSAGEQGLHLTWRWLVAAIALKLVVMLAVFPWYQNSYRGKNYADAARDIQRMTEGHVFYSNVTTASGLSVTAHLDILRLPRPPLTFPPAQWETGFVLARVPDPDLGQTVAQYSFGGDALYLLCRGDACAPARKDGS